MTTTIVSTNPDVEIAAPPGAVIYNTGFLDDELATPTYYQGRHYTDRLADAVVDWATRARKMQNQFDQRIADRFAELRRGCP